MNTQQTNKPSQINDFGNAKLELAMRVEAQALLQITCRVILCILAEKLESSLYVFEFFRAFCLLQGIPLRIPIFQAF